MVITGLKKKKSLLLYRLEGSRSSSGCEAMETPAVLLDISNDWSLLLLLSCHLFPTSSVEPTCSHTADRGGCLMAHKLGVGRVMAARAGGLSWVMAARCLVHWREWPRLCSTFAWGSSCLDTKPLLIYRNSQHLRQQNFFTFQDLSLKPQAYHL